MAISADTAGAEGRPFPVGAIVVDFDGTICPHDVSEEILEAFAPREWWEIDLEFQRGEIGSRECLTRQAALLKGIRDEMLAHALDRFAIDETFRPFVAWARGQGLDVSVASDGLGFYIEPMLEAGGVRGLPVFTNQFELVDGEPRFEFPFGHPFCVGCGTCKMRTVLSARRRHGGVAFVGEGHSDRYGALYSDLVFATKYLAELCERDGVPFVRWNDFDDVRAGLETASSSGDGAGLVGAALRAVCPGWTVR